MIKYCLLLLLVTLVTAQLSDECNYVKGTLLLTDVGQVAKCFNTLIVDQDVIDRILKNLDIIQDLYPYVDIAKNPPKKPDGYFKKMDYKAGLSDLKSTIAKSNKTFSQVIPPIMGFIKGFRDGHFSLKFQSTIFFDNIFASVKGLLPFDWEVETNDHYDSRHVYIRNPLWQYLSDEACDTIEDMYSQHYSVDTIDGVDAFTFLANIFGDYNEMKSPQGRLYMASTYSQPSNDGFYLLQYPIDGAFKQHKIVYSDSDHTEVTFNFGFLNENLASQSTRDVKEHSLLAEPFTLSQEKEVLEIVRNFKKRTVRSEHQILKCGLKNGMNYIIIKSFGYEGMQTLQYLQELAECIEDFNANDYPIIIALQKNGGGVVALEQLTEYMLMPNTTFRTVFAARKTDKTKKVMVDGGYFGDVDQQYEDDKKCTIMKTKSQLEEFWKYTETDKFGDVTHKRTKKIFYNSLANSQFMRYYQLWNARKPTDIIVTTEGYCFSACSIFVNNVIRYGAAIVAGYGLTNPGDNLFVAAQCPSNVIDPALYFEELSDNEAYGLTFRATVTESYNVSSKMDESIPGDYDILRIDKYMKYFDVRNIMTDEFFELVEGVHEEFQTKCNPLNKRLFKVTDECKSNDPNALRTGYACGANGEWDKKTCKITACKSPYVLDFDKNKCVAARPCDINYVPPTESSGLNDSHLSSSSIITPMMDAIIAAFVILFNLVN